MTIFSQGRGLVFVFLFISFSYFSANAAGYLEFNDEGTPYKWDSPVSYKLDTSDLGGLTKMEADVLVDSAFDAWEAIPGSTLTFTSAGNSSDITDSNINSFVNFNGTSCPVPEFLVVYDDTGDIFVDLFGGSSSGILGISTPSVINETLKKITCGYALINGAAVPDNSASTQESVLYTMMHEFGHGRNLQHTEINSDLYLDGGNSNDQYIPLMFPIIPQDLTSALMGGIGGIKLDDQFSFLTLYNPSLLLSEGRIRGKIRTRDDRGLLGVNVLCYDKNNPDENVVSWISDAELDGQGEYICGHLPAGDYQVKIEPVTQAINQWEEGTPPFIPAEYFNGANESSSASIDSLTEKTDIAVSTSTVENVNIIINDNGHISSEKKVTGSIDPSSVAELEYFIYVPEKATKATFKLEGSPSTADLDIYGKCNTPFSLALATAGPLYDPSSPGTQQAEFTGASNSGNENVELDSSSSPELDNCEYHVIVVNYSSGTATFELTATIEGPTPQLKVDFSPEKEVQDNSETLVSKAVFEADGDQFTVSSIQFTDTGVESIADVSTASIYIDDNNNGRVDSADIQLATTSNINTSDRTFTVSNLNLFIDEGEQKKILVTYTMPTTSSLTWPFILALFSLVLIGLIKGERKVRITFAVLLMVVVFGRCSGSKTEEFNPMISDSADLVAEASGFGEKYTIQVGKPSSVKDFFE